ncbi:MAG: hypothetical protein AAGD05_08195 [Bacteroidota bacterium]
MIEIKPEIAFRKSCEECDHPLENKDLIWQGAHICVVADCQQCQQTFVLDLPVAQSILSASQIKSDAHQLAVKPERNLLYHNLLLEIVKNPQQKKINIQIEERKRKEEVIILNCIDFIFGHAILSLLNLQNILNGCGEKGVIIITQPFLKWLIPNDERITEVWTVDIKMSEVKAYYEDLTHQINRELKRFKQVHLSKTHLQPKEVDIELFTQVKPYDFDAPPTQPRITYIWREDPPRLWYTNYLIYGALKVTGLAKILMIPHYFRILILFYLLKRKYGNQYRYSLAGMGSKMKFPAFIEDCRVSQFNTENEIKMCQVYAESVLVIGIHGSSMILPSAHSGMVLNLMPTSKWRNYIEDILYREKDVRLASFQRRIIPVKAGLLEIFKICKNMLTERAYFYKKFIYAKEEL